jgi:regulatory protein
MQITKISYQEKSTKLKIELDNGQDFKIRHEKTILDTDLYVGKNLDEVNLTAILKQDLINTLKQRTLDYISKRLKSTKEVGDYIDRKIDLYSRIESLNFEANEKEEIRDQVLKYLQDNKFLNDSEFAKAFVNYRLRSNPRGKFLLKKELQVKGISKDIIEKVLASISENDNLQNALDLAHKKANRLKETDKFKKKAKIQRFLSSKGYSWEIITKVLTKLSE